MRMIGVATPTVPLSESQLFQFEHNGCTCPPALHERLARGVSDGTWG